jgi:hypothetical protein
MPTPPPPEHSRFEPGQSGNPGGKPKGARNRLQGSFLNALADDFEKNGKKAIEQCREEDVGRYLSIVASLMPKQTEQTLPLDEVTDAELTAGIALLRARLAASTGEGAGQAPELSATH